MTDIETQLEHVQQAKRGHPVLRVKMPSGREFTMAKIGTHVRVRVEAPDPLEGVTHNSVLLDLTLDKADWLPHLLDLNNWVASQERLSRD